MQLVDTSVWVELFRRPRNPRVEEVLDLDQAVTCLPVVQEVLQGFREAGPFQIARTAMDALPIVESPLSRAVVDDAVDLYRSARRAGVTVRSSVDCLIAACALRHGLDVLHCDRDYEALSTISPLRTARLRL